ncbi:MAG TPA: hypothetical protein VG099_32295 [Gemmataceae bacterium]|jgi:hypothetical protein|nr:hypothetical protein [Gemmataceae bacterium]
MGEKAHAQARRPAPGSEVTKGDQARFQKTDRGKFARTQAS